MKPEKVMQRQHYNQFQDSMQDMCPHSAQKTDIVREEIFYPPPDCCCPGPKRRKARGGLGGATSRDFKTAPRLLTFLAFRFRPSAVSTLTNECFAALCCLMHPDEKKLPSAGTPKEECIVFEMKTCVNIVTWSILKCCVRAKKQPCHIPCLPITIFHPPAQLPRR